MAQYHEYGFTGRTAIVTGAGSGVKRMTFDLTAGYGQLVVVGHARYEDVYAPEINYMEFLAGKRMTGSVMGAITLRRDIPLR